MAGRKEASQAGSALLKRQGAVNRNETARTDACSSPVRLMVLGILFPVQYEMEENSDSFHREPVEDTRTYFRQTGNVQGLLSGQANPEVLKRS